MRVLLINPNRERMPFPVPPIGLCLVASAAEDAGHDVRLLDLCFDRRPRRAIIHTISDFDPEVVGVSIRNVDNTDCQHPVFYLPEIERDVIRLCREISPAPIVLGGSGFSILPAEVLTYTGCDWGVVGDGERAFVRLLDRFSRGVAPDFMPGLVRRHPDGKVTQSPADHIEDLDRLSPADVGHWVDIKAYERNGGGLNLQTKRGCQFRCVYCVYHAIEGRRYRLRSPASIGDEVADAVAAFQPATVEMADSTFNVPLDHAEAVCEELAGRRLPVRLQTSGINPGFVTAALLRAMERAGFVSMMITPESASDPVLRGLGKTFTKDDLIRATRLLGSTEMARFWFFLLGGTGETMETAKETFDFVETHIDARDLVFFATGIRIYPHTGIWHAAVEEGIIGPDQDLLRPTAYFSKHLDRDAFFDLVNRETCAHSNWIETVDGASHAAGRLATQALALLGFEPPFWPKIPLYNAVAGLFGVRRRLRRKRRRRAPQTVLAAETEDRR